MRIESEFKKSVFVSAMLHLFILLIFNVTLIPGVKNLKRESRISFYGSILADLDKMESKKEEGGYLSHLDKRLRFLLTDKITDLSGINYSKEAFYVPLEKPYVELVKHKKVFPYFRKEDTDFVSLAKDNASSKGEREIEFDLKNLVFSKSPFPEILYREDEENFNFKMRILVSAEGKVEFVEPLLFCGKPELDILVQKTIKEWSFLPYENYSGWYEIDFNPSAVTTQYN